MIDIQGVVHIKGTGTPVTKFCVVTSCGPGPLIPDAQNKEDGNGFFNFYHGDPLPSPQRIVLQFFCPGFWPLAVPIDFHNQSINLTVELEPSGVPFR